LKLAAFVLRVYSFVFHLTLSSFLLGAAGIAYWSSHSLNLDMLPFDDDTALRSTAILGAIGVACTLLALTRRFKFVFVIWTALALYLMAKGFVQGPYVWQQANEMKGLAWLTFGAVGAFFGAAWSLSSRRRLGIL